MTMTTRFAPTRLAAILAAATTAASLGLAAASAQERIPITFEYQLDRSVLSSPQGANRVYNDLRREARQACSLRGAYGRSTLDAIDYDCVAELVDKVVSAAASRTLSARHEDSRLYARARDILPSDALTIVLR
jgi:UrcA family protein